MKMSSTLQRRVLTLFKNSFSRNLYDSLYVRDGIIQRSQQISSRAVLRQKKNGLFQSNIRVTNFDVRMIHSASQPTSVTSKDEVREIMAVWPDILRDVVDANRHLDIPDVTKRLTKILQYNVPLGKKSRATSCVYAFKALAPPDLLTEENIRLARILGWCIEMLQGFLVMLDDIQDRAETRRNQPCWYLHNDLGLAAINDALLVERVMYQLLRKHFKGSDCYIDLIELFEEILLKTIMGQCLDLMSTNFGKTPNLDLFTIDRFNSIAKYKTSYYTFVLPVTGAMHMAGVKDPEMHRQARIILLELGNFFQVQDDYLDCYGDPEVTGKIGTDIQEGKCTWLAAVALQRATQKQKEILKECYGHSDPDKVARVKQVYNDIGLANTYTIYEEETYNLLHTHIQQISRGLPHDLFLKLLNKTYRRVG